MARKLKIIDKDYGWKKAVAAARGTKGGLVAKVGIMAPEAQAMHGDQTVVEVAAQNEFGIGVKERSFIRDYVDLQTGELRNELRRAAVAVLDGRASQVQALARVGLYAEQGMVGRIFDKIPPLNARETIARKDGNTPLVDSGTMVEAITNKVGSR